MGNKVEVDADHLAWLEFFYENIGDYLGPAGDDAYYLLEELFTEETGIVLPEEE